MASYPPQYTQDSQPSPDLVGRYRLARLVIIGSFLAILLMVSIQLSSPTSETVKSAFDTILPVLASWVGIVLAFYFSSATQDAATRNLRTLLAQTSPSSQNADAAIAAAMIPTAQISKLVMLDKTPAATTPLRELYEHFQAPLPTGGKVQRLIFVENWVFKYLLHSATLYAFMVKKGLTPDDLKMHFLKELLDDTDIFAEITKLVVPLSPATPLAAARTALSGVPGATDIIVTHTGAITEPMQGWLTDTDLAKAMKAS